MLVSEPAPLDAPPVPQVRVYPEAPVDGPQESATAFGPLVFETVAEAMEKGEKD